MSSSARGSPSSASVPEPLVAAAELGERVFGVVVPVVADGLGQVAGSRVADVVRLPFEAGRHAIDDRDLLQLARVEIVGLARAPVVVVVLSSVVSELDSGSSLQPPTSNTAAAAATAARVRMRRTVPAWGSRPRFAAGATRVRDACPTGVRSCPETR